MTGTKLNDNATTVLAALRSNKEYTDENNNGEKWGGVYLDNARPAGMSVTVFRAALKSLSAAGLYKVVDGFAWGSVKL